MMRVPGLDSPVGVCHHCARLPKLTIVALQPPTPVDGLEWYFHAPYEGNDPCHDPCRWCDPNRDTSLDPCLVDIIEVHKTKVLKDSARLARPSGWETSMGVQVALTDSYGATVQTRINFFCFIMNPEWRKLSVVKHVEKWLPDNLDYRGPVLKPPAPPSPIPTAPPSPRSPALDALLEETLLESTVSIEEVLPQSMDEELARLEAEAREAEPSDNEETFEYLRAKRRRLDTEN